jgi:hypothetical protein
MLSLNVQCDLTYCIQYFVPFVYYYLFLMLGTWISWPNVGFPKLLHDQLIFSVCIALSVINFLHWFFYFSQIQNTHLSRSLRWVPGDCLGNLGDDSSNKQSVIAILLELDNECFLAFWKSAGLNPIITLLEVQEKTF